MRNIPVFSTENGVGSLTLKEVPYNGIAYIKIADSQEPELFLKDCVDFCKAVGAECIYASGHSYLERYEQHTAIWRMCRSRAGLQDTDAALFPVTETTLESWREIYNRAMKNVANASYMTFLDARQMLKRGDGYFVHRGEVLLGIGIASGETIDAVVSNRPGAGGEVVRALAHALSGEQIRLEVAAVNERAVRLYERLGFMKTAEISRWYKII
jgi:hypothetical protein